MNSMPTVSVIVPCRNERDYIENSVRSILAQEPPPGGFEVIVADGMSDDGTRDILKRLTEEDSRLQVVDNPERIIPAGLNSAIRAAQGKIIVRMDAHTDYASDYVRQCFEVLHETGADNVGGPWIAEGKGLSAGRLRRHFSPPLLLAGRFATNLITKERWIRSILAAGRSKSLNGSGYSTKSWSEARTMNLTCG